MPVTAILFSEILYIGLAVGPDRAVTGMNMVGGLTLAIALVLLGHALDWFQQKFKLKV
jgi:hypothetical protein